MKKTILCVLASILVILVLGCSNKGKEHTMNLYYMDTYIYIKFYEEDNKKAENIKQEVESLYKEYHQLSDRYQPYDEIINVYDINHNNKKDNTLVLDSKLYDLLEYSKAFQEETSKLFNIEIGGLIDVWKKYREQGYGIPTDKELKKVSKYKELVLLENNKIKNNHPDIDLGAISKGYATRTVGEYFENAGVKDYLINAGGNVLVGKNSKKEAYQVGIQSPNKDGNLLTIVKVNNMSVVTSGSYERNYIYNGKTYSHIIDPNTQYPAEYMKSVTVITKDSALGDVLSTTLFLMTVEEGLKFIKNYEAEAIWVTNTDEIIRSEGFSAYE